MKLALASSFFLTGVVAFFAGVYTAEKVTTDEVWITTHYLENGAKVGNIQTSLGTLTERELLQAAKSACGIFDEELDAKGIDLKLTTLVFTGVRYQFRCPVH